MKANPRPRAPTRYALHVQDDLFRDHAVAPTLKVIDLGPGCRCTLTQGVVASPGALVAELRDSLPWMQEVYRNFGRCVPAPRLTSYHGDPDATYRYSGIEQVPHPWTPRLANLRDLVSARAGVRFNAVLVNHYRDGRDGMGYHADDEPELGPARDDIAIACLSLGAPRRFVFKPRRGVKPQAGTDEPPGPRALSLESGSLLVMRGLTQLHWLHALPKTRRPVGPRTSLTFRVVLSASARR